MCKLNLNFKILGEIMVCHTGILDWGVEGNLLLAMCRLNLNFKILLEILVHHMGGQSSFGHVQAKSELQNFR